MSQDERSILIQHLHLCGDHAVEWMHPEFRSEKFDEWMQDMRPPELMRDRVVRTTEITERLVGCAYCWSVVDRNEVGTFSVEFTIDGDA